MNLRIQRREFWGNLVVLTLFLFALGFLYALFEGMQAQTDWTFDQLHSLDETARTP